MTSSERRGLFGGTFDPPHIGHLVAAVNVLHALSLDQVLFVVSNSPWQKVRTRFVSSAEDRYAMVEAALAGHDGLAASRIEIDRGGESSSVDTLEQLHSEQPGRELFLIVGSDAAAGFATWRNHKMLPSLATIVIVDRAPLGEIRLPWPARVERVVIPPIGISSTDLRARAGTGQPIDFLVPDAVAAVVRKRLLYRDDDADPEGDRMTTPNLP